MDKLAAVLLRPTRNLMSEGLVWMETEIVGDCVAEPSHQERDWSTTRRLILIRQCYEWAVNLQYLLASQ